MANDDSNGSSRVKILVATLALIGTLGAAAIVSKCGGGDDPPDRTYIGRVTDVRNQRPIKSAAISVFTSGEKKETFSGEGGAFNFTLSSKNQTARLTVNAPGYQIYDNPVFPLTKQDLEDVRLTPLVGEIRLSLPPGTRLKAAINYAAGKDAVPFGVSFIGRCDPKLMQAQLSGTDEFHGKDMSDIIGQFKFRLLNPPAKASYNVTRIEERKVYQIECTN